jgi:hypothetical protein
MKKMLLFTARISAGNERCVDLPGFSHWGQPRQYGEELVRTIYFFAPNRTQAARDLGTYGVVGGPCELSEGRRCDTLLPSYLR